MSNLFKVKLLNKTKDGSAIICCSHYFGDNEYCQNTQSEIYSNTKQNVLWNNLFLPNKTEQPELYTELPIFLQAGTNNVNSLKNKRTVLWRTIDSLETRSDAQFARLIEIEMNSFTLNEDNLRFIKNYINDNFIDKGIVVDASIHKPTDKGNKKNMLYLMCTLRSYKNGVFVNKNREWNSKELLSDWKTNAQDLINKLNSSNPTNNIKSKLKI